MDQVRTGSARASGIVRAARTAGYESLRWVASAAVLADGGLAWPLTALPGSPVADDLYDGTAGVLAAFTEARLSGSTSFDDHARAGVSRLRRVAAAARHRGDVPDLSLYTGLSGIAWALATWADDDSRPVARSLVSDIARLAVSRPDTGVRDLLEGDAGVLLTLTSLGRDDALQAASALADRMVAGAHWPGGEPDWPAGPGIGAVRPNFSHGAAGIAYALAAASTRLARPDLLHVASSAGRRLIRLGDRPDGSLAVPYLVPPDPSEPEVSYGWCHGPTGTLRLFVLLDRLRPGQGWDRAAGAARRAVRLSGVPARLYPGFWDNLGQCCGTAGVGELALDRYQETADGRWLAWARELAADVLGRRIEDQAGVRWSHTEYRASPPELEPAIGWMQGAAGIAAWLLRLARLHEQGPTAPRLPWPDRPSARR
ncbi:MAG TPA: lanthionine synthetase LanC family protein [Streptosporangiaceae bacterium]|nr:lanthionine synthetase LanC family protein [Streptosporangiaceae bacterium]